MTDFIALVEKINNLVWAYVLPVGFLGLGIMLTIQLRAFPQRHIQHSIKYLVASTKRSPEPGSLSPLSTLSLALSATIGIGNIIGVLAAIQFGGPGALFWMWVVGILGMTLKFSETTLSVKYRIRMKDGYYSGGPMYYLRDGAGSKTLANIFAVSAMLGIFMGIGTFPQVHSIVNIFTYTFNTPLFLTATILTFSVDAITTGGLKNISRIALIVMPFILFLFITGSGYLLIRQWHLIPSAFHLIFTSAFSKTAVAGGGAGYAVKRAIEFGTRRGIFSNESGLGSASIAAATASNQYPAEQGLIHVLEVVIDTLIMNTIVGLLVIVSGAYTTSGPEQALLDTIFHDPYFIGQITMTVCLIFFAFTSIVAWSYYGSQCAYYMWGLTGQKYYHYIFVLIVFIASFVDWETIWTLTDITTAILVIPNLVGLYLLRKDVVDEVKNLKNALHDAL